MVTKGDGYMNYLDSPIDALKGVGPTRSRQLEKLGIKTIRDLVYFFPRAYEKRGDIRHLANAPIDTPVAMLLTVASTVKSVQIKNRLTISKFRAFDESGSVEVVFFNSPYVKDIFTVGATFRFYGRLSYSKKLLQLTNPKYEPYIELIPLPDFVPIYPSTGGLSSKIIDSLMKAVIDEASSLLPDSLPESIRLKNSLPTIGYAIKNAHFPQDEESLSKALSRMAFDEMLLFGLGISLQARHKNSGDGIRFSPCSLKPVLDLLPYKLTDDQKAAVNDIYRDTVIGIGDDKNINPMTRILVGDVGSGKTVCAILAMYIAVSSGYQAALMVPTEILALQHYSEVSTLFGKLGIKVELLIGSTTPKEKKRILSDIESGEAQVVIGTHALITGRLEFKNLGLIITDEQHRFGVNQRGVLKEKCMSAHMLVMSATPIPRTLALTLYGDLDISRIVTMPKGRMRVDTYTVDESYRKRLDDFIKKQIALGGQCYIVCPAIEVSDDQADGEIFSPTALRAPFGDNTRPPLKSAVEYSEELKMRMPDVRIACLHGKMKPSEKDAIMQAFSKGETDILVSTTVIEVGINVPNASLMIVENAERFGLSQLHQLRGRVGRGSRRSYCVLVSEMKSEKALARLDVMRTTYDGYEIAEKDLALRGPGDFFSTNTHDNFRQSGGFEFRFAKLCDDSDLFSAAFSTARAIVAADPQLELPEHSLLKKALDDIISQNGSSIS